MPSSSTNLMHRNTGMLLNLKRCLMMQRLACVLKFIKVNYSTEPPHNLKLSVTAAASLSSIFFIIKRRLTMLNQVLSWIELSSWFGTERDMFNPLTPVLPITVRDEPWSFFHFNQQSTIEKWDFIMSRLWCSQLDMPEKKPKFTQIQYSPKIMHVQELLFASARRSSSCGWLRVAWAWVLETARTSLRLHDKGARTSLR